MAKNRVKQGKKSNGAEELKQEKQESVTVRELVKDERTHKITGTVLLLISFFLFISFISYCFTWKQDQDKVLGKGISFLFGKEETVANLLGRLGAWTSHLFIYRGFGAASFLFCTLFFVAGINLLLGKKIFSLWRNFRYVLVGLLFFSTAFAFVFKGQPFAWGGAAGELLSGWLSGLLGSLGTGIFLAVTGFIYIIWRFNPVFKLPQKKEQLIPVEESLAEVNEEAAKETEPGDNTIPKKNILKGDKGIVVVPPVQQENNGLNDFKVIEKEIPLTNPEPFQPIIEEPKEIIPPPVVSTALEIPPVIAEKPKAKPVDTSGLELEIKQVPDEAPKPEEETPAKKVENLPPYDPVLDLRDYKYPKLDLLENHGGEKIVMDPSELETNKTQIINTLRNYDIEIQKIMATVGPTVTLYEIVPAAGVRISRIKNLEDDIALSLAALGIRIIAPIPGKGTIGIEVPNLKKTVVSMRTLLSSEKFQKSNASLPIALGKKIDNENFIVDLATMPHLLMAGATGQGKSVGVNAILVSLLYKKHPSQLKLVLVDPKKVELSLYRHIEKHFLAKLPGEDDAIITDTKKVVHTLNALCIEMDNRYDLLKEAHCRNIREYNEKFIARKLNPEKGHQYLPFIVLVIDEFADLIMTAGKEVEMPIARLAQLARAVGIHLIIATQRPSVNIITGTIKANFPARIAFKVSSKVDSRTILDAGGAEQLIGKGDMLVSYNGEITRLQCAFVDTPEVEEVCDFISDQRGYPQAFLLPEYVDEKELEGKDFDMSDRDALFEDAARLIVQSQMGSTSLLQRRMKLGYNRAGRLMDQLEAAGIVGANQGSKARDVLIKTEMELEQHLSMLG
ncbi:MAG: DNA translocase FtsK [Sphingobacteriales bacterium]|nr:MAG: DNA translocase FtsK [Sphingobacteriales bacterium]